MKPSDVLKVEVDAGNFGGTFGCAEIEQAARCVVLALVDAGDDWGRVFGLKTARKFFAGDDAEWSMIVCHRHSSADTSNCMLTNWLDVVGPDKWRLSPEFVTRVTRGRQATMNMVDAARVRLYCKAARQIPGLTLDDVKLVGSTENDERYIALIGGFEVYIYEEAVYETSEGFKTMLSEAPDEQTVFDDNGVSLTREQIEDSESANTQAEVVAELLMSDWSAGQ